jgi:hypothetical protein
MREQATFGTLFIVVIVAQVAAVKDDDERLAAREVPASARSEEQAACREGTPREAREVSRTDGAAGGFVVTPGDTGARDRSCDPLVDFAGDEEGELDEGSWTSAFTVDEADLASIGRNPYFILEPGYQLDFEGREDGEPLTLTITVLDETKTVGNVMTRVVEERETKGERVVEVSRNFFAVCKRTNNVYYFGEVVDIYKDGEVVGHEGSWLAGEGGARFGLAMPGSPLLGARYYQEIAPRRAMDRAEVVSLSATMDTPAGKFRNVLKTVETTPLEPGQKEAKYYANGVGLLRDGPVKLVRYGAAKK